jgi:uncharacterized membrane protein YsdA (DUF1294 family)/cold shock CspA family protein
MDRGVVTTFDDDRGFGFIRSKAYPQDIFVHVSGVPGRARLKPGQRVSFEIEVTDRGPRAVGVKLGLLGPSPATLVMVGLAVALALACAGLRSLGVPWLWTWPLAINPLCFAAFAHDKHRARSGGRRVPEAVLHAFSLAGGSPAAILAVFSLHHKNRKASFLAPLALIVVAQLALLVGWWRGH